MSTDVFCSLVSEFKLFFRVFPQCEDNVIDYSKFHESLVLKMADINKDNQAKVYFEMYTSELNLRQHSNNLPKTFFQSLLYFVMS